MTPDKLKSQTPFVPTDEIVVEDLETLKVLADPLRLRIRELMRDPTTVKQVAHELDLPPTKLYYHINLLEKHGLIVVVDTRIVSGIIEKHYQITARSVRVARHLLSPTSKESAEGLAMTINGLFEDTRADLMKGLQTGVIVRDEDADPHRGLLLNSFRFLLNDEQAKEFYHRLEKLLADYRTLSDAHHEAKDRNVRIYKAFTAVFPSSRSQRHEE